VRARVWWWFERELISQGRCEEGEGEKWGARERDEDENREEGEWRVGSEACAQWDGEST
jgi:hypothetical protein